MKKKQGNYSIMCFDPASKEAKKTDYETYADFYRAVKAIKTGVLFCYAAGRLFYIVAPGAKEAFASALQLVKNTSFRGVLFSQQARNVYNLDEINQHSQDGTGDEDLLALAKLENPDDQEDYFTSRHSGTK